MRAKRLVIPGGVQGVGYRAWMAGRASLGFPARSATGRTAPWKRWCW